jgi:hypothetical protein
VPRPPYLVRLSVERNDHAVRVTAQDGCGKQGRHIDAAHLRGCPAATVTRDRAAHRARRIKADDDRTRKLRDVTAGNLGGLVKRRLDLLRNFAAGVEVSRQILVRKLPRLTDFVSVRNAADDVIDHLGVRQVLAEHLVTQKRVEVHAQRLRSHLAGNRLADERTLSHIGQQVPADRQVTEDQRLKLRSLGPAVRSQRLDLLRQVGLGGGSSMAANPPTILVDSNFRRCSRPRSKSAGRESTLTSKSAAWFGCFLGV